MAEDMKKAVVEQSLRKLQSSMKRKQELEKTIDKLVTLMGLARNGQAVPPLDVEPLIEQVNALAEDTEISGKNMLRIMTGVLMRAADKNGKGALLNQETAVSALFYMLATISAYEDNKQ